jgi:hypothetical protein
LTDVSEEVTTSILMMEISTRLHGSTPQNKLEMFLTEVSVLAV